MSEKIDKTINIELPAKLTLRHLDAIDVDSMKAARVIDLEDSVEAQDHAAYQIISIGHYSALYYSNHGDRNLVILRTDDAIDSLKVMARNCEERIQYSIKGIAEVNRKYTRDLFYDGENEIAHYKDMLKKGESVLGKIMTCIETLEEGHKDV